MRKTTGLLQTGVRLEASGVLPAGLLNACARAGVPFWRAEPVDACTLRLTVHRRDLKRLRRLAVGAQCSLRVCGERGAPVWLRRVRCRWALLAGLPVCLVLWFLSSLFIWDIDVTGNCTIPDHAILRVLEDNGVGIGSFWPAFTSDMIRCNVLLQMPELRWVTVNVKGSRATVVVRERTPLPEVVNEAQPADVVARKAGIVSQVRVLCGTAAVVPGQTVLPGELLISSVVDSSFAGARQVHAVGEVLARTWYDSAAVTPLTVRQKCPADDGFSKWAVAIGKERINFYRNSSIWYDGYDKITTETQLELAGIFALPVTIIQERFVRYDTRDVPLAPVQAERMLTAWLQQQLALALDGAEPVTLHCSAAERDALLTVTLRAECLENIAVTVEHDPQRGMNS